MINILHILMMGLLIIGVMVCAKGMAARSILHKGGFFFCLFYLIEHIYTLVFRLFVDRIVQSISQGGGSVGYTLYLLQIPSTVLRFIAFFILILCFYLGLSRQTMTGPKESEQTMIPHERVEQ